MSSLSAVVVGAGPAGSLMSIILANQGYNVDLVERIPDFHVLNEKKTFVYILNLRSFKALKYAGLELPFHVASRLNSAVMHRNGKTFPRLYTESQKKYSVGRTDLTKYLLKEAKSHKSGNIKLHLGWTLHALENGGETARFRKTRSKKEEEEQKMISGSVLLKEGPENRLDLRDYDLLVGADGANSVTRGEMVRLDAEKGVPDKERLTFFQNTLTSSYKRLPPLSPEQIRKSSFAENPDGIHFFMSKSGNMLGAPKADGCFYNVLILPDNEKNKSFNFYDAGDVESFMKSEYPDLLELYMGDDPNFIPKFAKEPLVPGGVSTHCSHFHRGRAVIIGDAAHSMYATFGEGCNCALEDCLVLGKVLEKSVKKGDKEAIPEALSLYSSERKPDVEAIVNLSENSSLSGGGARSMATMAQLMFRFSVLSLAEKVDSNWGPKQILDDTLPYSDIKVNLDRENYRALSIFLGTFLCFGIAIMGGSTLYKVLKKVS